MVINSSGAVIATHDLLSGKHQQSVLQSHYVGLIAPKAKNPIANRPQYDPYWEEKEDVEVRDLSVYETVAFSGDLSVTVH